MCGGDAPEDKSVELERMRIAEENRRREEEAQKAAEEKAAFQQRLGSAFDFATEDARGGLTSRGLTESEFLPMILRRLNMTRESVPMLDPSPGNYFMGVADQVLNEERDRRRSSYGSAFDKFAGNGFAEQRIADTADDDIINSLIDEDMNRATIEAQRARDRGAITGSGYDAVIQNLGRQRSGVNSRLQDMGFGLLEEGRTKLRNIANSGRGAASTYELGNTFNPMDYQSQLDTEYGTFRSALSDKLRGKIGTTPLFDTSNLFNIAGAAQGAGNTKNIGEIIAADDEDKKDEERGLGTTGAF